MLWEISFPQKRKKTFEKMAENKFYDRFVKLAMGSGFLLVSFMVLLFMVQIIGSLFFVGQVVNWSEEAGPPTTARLYNSTYNSTAGTWSIQVDASDQPVYSADFTKWKADQSDNDEIISNIKAFLVYLFGSLYLVFALLTVLGIDLDKFIGGIGKSGSGKGSSGGF